LRLSRVSKNNAKADLASQGKIGYRYSKISMISLQNELARV